MDTFARITYAVSTFEEVCLW